MKLLLIIFVLILSCCASCVSNVPVEYTYIGAVQDILRDEFGTGHHDMTHTVLLDTNKLIKVYRIHPWCAKGDSIYYKTVNGVIEKYWRFKDSDTGMIYVL